LGDLLAVVTQSLLTKLCKMSAADNELNLVHFGSDPVNTWIWPIQKSSSNRRSLSCEVNGVQRVACTWRWRRYDLSKL